MQLCSKGGPLLLFPSCSCCCLGGVRSVASAVAVQAAHALPGDRSGQTELNDLLGCLPSPSSRTKHRNALGGALELPWLLFQLPVLHIMTAVIDQGAGRSAPAERGACSLTVSVKSVLEKPAHALRAVLAVVWEQVRCLHAALPACSKVPGASPLPSPPAACRLPPAATLSQLLAPIHGLLESNRRAPRRRRWWSRSAAR